MTKLKQPNAARTMSRWIDANTPEAVAAVAKAAKTSVAHLHHIAKGRRKARADLAMRIADATYAVSEPVTHLDQRDLCATCARCSLAR